MRPQRVTSILWAAVIVLAAIPLIVDDQYIFHVLTMAGIYAILAISLNLLLGSTGLFSLGHAAFYGIGAYTSALLTLRLELPFVAAFVLSGIITALIGRLVAYPALRLKGIFLAIGTMGFNEIVRLLAINLDWLTGGPAGLPGIPSPEIFGVVISQPRDYYLLILVLAAATYIVFQRLISSRTGRALLAIRDDEIAARSAGIDLTGYKVGAFTLSTFFAGLAGSFFAHYLTYVSPDNFGLNESFAILAMIALGGIGNFTGSVVGAFLLVVIPEAFRFLQEYRELIYGFTIVITVLVLPSGVVGWYPRFMRRRKMAGRQALAVKEEG
ncbi:branched-chain amino acid ABC transporter permease|uniref:Amino acid/amide ABC transporter membrane protein 2, HAAT family n=1 Tax=Dendrosporobacter quercicolus TaxID=146817 RepID=A0A1G9NKU7_9FIRM|nr:branched-chain amino acid ABC transporter permease [Dendrosporobacter quercicolus]NSL47369.1 branched-chain amino acid ABC transporter permease [Dendrosporobacter quercicolus DSM 1736]SDL86943.1 amino acid/amide ABC transporter membrane protein 2, HAAT family [Dendrosporobacter quercicolus]